MPTTSDKSIVPSERLLEALSDYDQILVVMHDNPDPDAIATGWATLCLLQERLKKPARLVGGGAILRAENKYMVELLSPPIELLDDLETNRSTAAILVDCGVDTTNHLAARADIEPVAVIDHHSNGRPNTKVKFKDIRVDAAAAASIAGSYLREQRIDPGCKLATAILYAIRTETCGGETAYSKLDRSVVTWATAHADPELLAEIENAPLEREYYGDLVLALQNTFVYDDSAICFLPRIGGGEVVGEVADLLIRCRGVTRVLCVAALGEDVLVSARTEQGCGNAARLIQQTLQGLGNGGGHLHRAGGKIPHVARNGRLSDDLHDLLRDRWLQHCMVDRQRGTRLISRREIVENL